MENRGDMARINFSYRNARFKRLEWNLHSEETNTLTENKLNQKTSVPLGGGKIQSSTFVSVVLKSAFCYPL